ncbi:cytochrome P450 [Lentinula novae-zelandiae]|nr:cytochrome P450 [Lentinula novae-zelandiae]
MYALAIYSTVSSLFIQAAAALDHIPAFGPKGRLTSYWGSFHFLSDACNAIQTQIDQYGKQLFRVPFLDHWEVVVSDPKLIKDLAYASNEELSAIDAVADVLQTEFTMGHSIKYDRYHINVIGSTLTRNLVPCFMDIHDELTSAFIDVLPSQRMDDWVQVVLFDAVMDIVARTGNRLFVGLPLCRNPQYLSLVKRWATEVFLSAFFINFMPWVLKPMRQRIVALRRRHFRHPGKKELYMLVHDRVKLDQDHGMHRPDRPNDIISWFYNAAYLRYKPDSLAEEIVNRIMFLNFSAIHTSTHKYILPLREEVENIVTRVGWTKAALNKMIKVDSFVRESERFNGLSCLIMTRKVVSAKGFTFSNGVTLPEGTCVSVANYAIHHDPMIYKDAHLFEGFRFSDLRTNLKGQELHHQMVHTTPQYVTFGHGKHSCPGIFFATNELKLALAHIVLNYDVKLGINCCGVKPKNSWLSIALIPHRQAHVMFKKRTD